MCSTTVHLTSTGNLVPEDWELLVALDQEKIRSLTWAISELILWLWYTNTYLCLCVRFSLCAVPELILCPHTNLVRGDSISGGRCIGCPASYAPIISKLNSYNHHVLPLLAILPIIPSPLLQCNSCNTSSSFVLPVITITGKRWGQDLCTPAVERTSLKLSLSRSDIIDIQRFHNVCQYHWSCPFGKNYFIYKMIKPISQWWVIDAESFDRILEKLGPMYSEHTPFDPCGMIIEFECGRQLDHRCQSQQNPLAILQANLLASILSLTALTFPASK